MKFGSKISNPINIIKGEVRLKNFQFSTLSKGNGADLHDILDGAVHRADADGGRRREGEEDQGELENGDLPHPRKL